MDVEMVDEFLPELPKLPLNETLLSALPTEQTS